MKSLLRAVLIAALFAFSIDTAQAIVVASGAPNNTSPPDDPGFNNVGKVIGGFTASCVYLGNQWVITADHNAPVNSVVLAGQTFTIDTVHRNVGGNGVDLQLLHLTDDPGLPTLQITPTAPVNQEAALIVGYGYENDNSPIHYYNVDATDPQHLVYNVQSAPATPGASDVAGFTTQYTQTKRWGANAIEGASLINFKVTLDDQLYTHTTPIANEAIPALYDSGGAAFVNGRLAGVITGGYRPENAPAALLGFQGGIVSLSRYRQQIIAITNTNILGDTNADGVVNQIDLNNVRNHTGELYTTHLNYDLNANGSVDFADFQILSAHFGVSVTPFQGDVSGDGKVDNGDFLVILNQFSTHGQGPAGDADGDGDVDFADYQIVSADFGKSIPVGDLNHNFVVDYADYQLLSSEFGKRSMTTVEILGDTDGDGDVDSVDEANVLNNWTSNISPVPEPSTFALLAIGTIGIGLHRKAPPRLTLFA